MVVKAKRKRRGERILKCPICPSTVTGDMDTLTDHISNAHTAPQNRMSGILWINPPHEAVFLGKLYKGA